MSLVWALVSISTPGHSTPRLEGTQRSEGTDEGSDSASAWHYMPLTPLETENTTAVEQ